MKRFVRTWAIFVGLCGLTGSLPAADRPGASVVVVLDCSLRMSEQLDSGSGDADTTRFNAARKALQTIVGAATNREEMALGVVCFGHRLAWDEGEQPDLVEQSEYLSQTAGFAAISNLLPVNDVETLRRPLRLTEEDARFAKPILDTLRPWGEAPVNRALVLAERQFAAAGASDSGIVLITAGGDKLGTNNNNSAGNYTRQSVLESYYKRRVPIHVIAVGAAPHANEGGWADLRLIARRTQGSFQPVENAEDVQEAVRLAVSAVVDGADVPNTPAIPRDAEAVPRPTVASDVRESREPAGDRQGAAVEGVVLCYGKPMRRARVVIEGVAVAPAMTDGAGEFRFRTLPPGKYEVTVSGDSHHRPYSGKSTLIVPEQSVEPLFLEFDLR